MSHIQSIIFDKHYWSISASKLWLQHHNFYPIKKVHMTKNFYRYRMMDPSHFSHFVTKKLFNHIDLIIGYQ